MAAIFNQLKDPSLVRNHAYIDGNWLEALNNETFPVTDPATADVLAVVPR
jgi:succinate-semialdehyde dehydrogenase/glutarate-semialdehyde dehydrogenase